MENSCLHVIFSISWNRCSLQFHVENSHSNPICVISAISHDIAQNLQMFHSKSGKMRKNWKSCNFLISCFMQMLRSDITFTLESRFTLILTMIRGMFEFEAQYIKITKYDFDRQHQDTTFYNGLKKKIEEVEDQI